MRRDPEADFQCADCGREAARLRTVDGRLVCEPGCLPATDRRRAVVVASQLPASTPTGIAAAGPGAGAGSRPMA